MTRTGSFWDLLAAVAVVLPLGSLAGRRWAVAGPFASVVAWVLLLVAGAAPEIGRFAPDGLALAASAGMVLIVTAVIDDRLADDGGLGASPPLVAGLGPVAAAACFVIGLVEPPDLGSGAATALVGGAAVVAAALVLAPPPALLLLPVVLLAGFRGATELADPSTALGLGLVAVAAVLAVDPVRRRGRESRLAGAEPNALAVAAFAVAACPVAAARPGGLLLGAAAVLVAAGPPHGWFLLAAAPGAAVVAAGLADVPAPGSSGVPAHLAFALLALAVAAGIVAPVDAGSSEENTVDRWGPAAVAAAGLAAWLLVAPGSWRWAAPVPELLEAWDRAAGVAAAVGVAVVIVVAARAARDRLAAEAAH